MDVVTFAIIGYGVVTLLLLAAMQNSFKKVDNLRDGLTELERKQLDDNKTIGGILAFLKSEAANTKKELAHNLEAIKEEQHKFDSELTWLKMELSNLSKDVKELSNELFGDGVADEVVESEEGINYFYDKGVIGKVAHALDRIAKLNDKVETYYLANNNYHVSIGKQVSSLKAKLDK